MLGGGDTAKICQKLWFWDASLGAAASAGGGRAPPPLAVLLPAAKRGCPVAQGGWILGGETGKREARPNELKP